MQSNAATHFKTPAECDEHERREFARLVREGFRGSDAGLPGRIESAILLGFHYRTDGTLAAIAGLKAPGVAHCRDVFEKAAAPVDPNTCGVELGWVYVVPEHRRKRVAKELCRRLLARVPDIEVFATTRPDNDAMIRILSSLSFRQVGNPYPRRDEELVVFLRPRTASRIDESR